MTPPVTPPSARRTWRVRGWIRAPTIAAPLLFLAPLIWPTAVNPTWTHGTPTGEYPWIGLFYAIFAGGIWASHRARIELTGTTLTITNPWGTTTIHTNDVTAVTPGSWGAQIHRTGHRPLTAFAVQSTDLFFRNRPRWVDLAHAVTGEEPEWREDPDEDDEDPDD